MMASGGEQAISVNSGKTTSEFMDLSGPYTKRRCDRTGGRSLKRYLRSWKPDEGSNQRQEN